MGVGDKANMIIYCIEGLLLFQSLKVDPLKVTVTTSPGAITASLIQLMKQLSTQGGNVSPGPLLKQLCKRSVSSLVTKICNHQDNLCCQ